jgi:hypothetical protein
MGIHDIPLFEAWLCTVIGYRIHTPSTPQKLYVALVGAAGSQKISSWCLLPPFHLSIEHLGHRYGAIFMKLSLL